MKKVMVGILVMVPIIIMLVIALVSTILVVGAHIGVESISLEFKNPANNGVLELELKDGLIHNDNFEYDLNDYYSVKILPERASVKEFTWSLEGIVCNDSAYEAKYNEYLDAVGNDSDYDGDIVYPCVMFVSTDDDGNIVKIDENGKRLPLNPDGSISSEGSYIEIPNSKTGKLIVSTYCEFTVKVQAESKSDVQITYIAGYDVESIKLKPSTDSNSLKVGETLLLNPEYNPIDSIVTYLEWYSSDTNVAVVDANGAVTAKSSGNAVISVKALIYSHINDGGNYTDSDFIVGSFSLTVNPALTFKGDTYITHKRQIDLAEIGIDPSQVTNTVNGQVLDGVLYVNSGSSYCTLTINGSSLKINICEEDDIVIDNADIYSFKDGDPASFIFDKGGISLVLTARWKSQDKEGMPVVVWSTNNNSVATVDGGKIQGVGSGLVTITATRENKSAEIQLHVEEKVTSLILKTSNESLAVGIAKETVFGSFRFADNNPVGDENTLTSNEIEIRIARPFAPADTADEAEKVRFYSAFEFSVDAAHAELCYFKPNSNILVLRSDKITEKTKITVTVKAKYPKNQSAETAARCIKQVDINVTRGIEANNHAEMRKIFNINYKILSDNGDASTVNKKPFYDVSIMKDIFFEEGLTDGSAEGQTNFSEALYGSLYGNAHMVMGWKTMSRNDRIFNVKYDNIVISNVIIRCKEIDESGEISAEDTHSLVGVPLYLGNEFTTPARFVGLRIEYSILENSSSAIHSYNADFVLDGCIIRNTSSVAIFLGGQVDGFDKEGKTIRSEADYEAKKEEVVFYPCYSHVTLKNCIMSNMVATAMSVAYSHYTLTRWRTPYPDGFVEGMLERNENLTVKQEGFLDLYNWQPTSSIKLIDTGTPAIDDILSQGISGALQSESLKDYSAKYNGESYLHMGIIVTGLYMGGGIDKAFEPIYFTSGFTDERFVVLTSKQIIQGMDNLLASLFTPILGSNEILFYLYDNNTAGDIRPGVNPPYNSIKLYDKLHGKS